MCSAAVYLKEEKNEVNQRKDDFIQHQALRKYRKIS